MKKNIQVITGEDLNEYEIQLFRNLQELNLIRNVIEKMQTNEPGSQEDRAMLKYINKPNVDTVAKEMNVEGFRLKSPVTGKDIKYISNDITKLFSLTDKELLNKPAIYTFARALYRFNIGKIGWNEICRICEKLI